jgi:hypothetical protein
MGVTLRPSPFLPSRGHRRDGKGAAVGAAALLAVGLAGCSLEEITLVESEDVVVAEVYVQVAAGGSGENRATAWLHRTLDGGARSSRPVPGADVLVTGPGGFSVELAPAPDEICVSTVPVRGTGSCYATSADFAARFRPGDVLRLEIALPGGGLLRGTSTVPGDFRLLTPAQPGRCVVEALTPLEVRWTRSTGAWAYVNETLVAGLRAALASQGITVEQDPLYLFGLSVAAADTTIVFPGEFGVFNRFELDQGVALALQRGLPEATSARVVITAVDRNYVNWVRGGNFNPSGQVKVPSLHGDGTGVFGSSVSRRFEVASAVGPAPGVGPRCDG